MCAATDSQTLCALQPMRAHLYGALVHMMRAGGPAAGVSEHYVMALLDVLGRDAIGGAATSQCTAYGLLAMLVQQEDGGRRMRMLDHKGYLAHMVGDVARDDAAVARALHGDGASSLAPVFVCEARLCFLLAAAKSVDAARVLLLSGVMSQLAATRALAAPSPDERAQRLLLWALRFVSTMLASLGRKNNNVVEQTLHFINAYFHILADVLRSKTPGELLGYDFVPCPLALSLSLSSGTTLSLVH